MAAESAQAAELLCRISDVGREKSLHCRRWVGGEERAAMKLLNFEVVHWAGEGVESPGLDQNPTCCNGHA